MAGGSTAESPTLSLRLFSGTAHEELARAIASKLGCDPSVLRIRKFADGEIHLVCTESVRGSDAYVVQPTCPPVNDNLMELLIAVDALRRASATHVTAVIPYFGYARQEKKDLPREPITARLVADLLERAGANRIMVLDLHAGAIQGFFRIPVDHLTAVNLLAQRVSPLKDDRTVVVSPDEGGVKHARRFAGLLGAPLAVVYSPASDRASDQWREVAGEVRGRRPILVEDIIATGSSVMRACDALLSAGCLPEITVCATHGLFVGGALQALESRAEITRILVTDSVPQVASRHAPKVEVVTVAGLLGRAIQLANAHGSIRHLFDPQAVF